MRESGNGTSHKQYRCGGKATEYLSRGYRNEHPLPTPAALSAPAALSWTLLHITYHVRVRILSTFLLLLPPLLRLRFCFCLTLTAPAPRTRKPALQPPTRESICCRSECLTLADETIVQKIIPVFPVSLSLWFPQPPTVRLSHNNLVHHLTHLRIHSSLMAIPRLIHDSLTKVLLLALQDLVRQCMPLWEEKQSW